MPTADLDLWISQTMQAYHISAVGAAIAKDDDVIWSQGYGMANHAALRPPTANTVFMLASISKTITCLALMQLWENGNFGLNEDINPDLPFGVVNPNYPTTPITFRQLLTHTASLDDNWAVMFSTYCQGDSHWALGDYTYAYFVPGGFYYSATANFETSAPGARWEYCNHNFVLAGYLVEAISGLPFAEYCRDSIFEPLGMDETSWFVADLDTTNMAMPYHFDGLNYQELGHFSYADYPAGALRTSAPQLARFYLAMAQQGQYQGARVLDGATVDEITTIQFPHLYSAQGLAWFRNYVAGRAVWRHGGGDQGVSTIASFDPAADVAVVVLTSGESPAGTQAIEAKLYEMLLDSDGDGVVGLYDNCPEEFNPEQGDLDDDTIGDACDNCLGFDNSIDADSDTWPDLCDNCPLYPNAYQGNEDGDELGDACDPCPLDGLNDLDEDGWCADVDNCPLDPNPGQEDSDFDGIGDACDFCCQGRVGDANGAGGEEPTIGDVSVLLDLLFISADPDLVPCLGEADINLSGGAEPTPDDITIGDVSYLIDYLFITGWELGLPDCI
jgi:CubicO group peptidase (beta-lactamase class C family)